MSLIGSLQQGFSASLCAAVTGARFMPQLVPVQAHQGSFRAGEERGKKKKD